MLHFDCETDGLLDVLTKVHCLIIYDDKTDQTYTCDPNNLPIEYGVNLLMNGDGICGHNIIAFDVPALKKVYPWFKPQGKILDTLVISRVTYPDIGSSDFMRVRKGDLPANLIGKYNLESWGYRMRLYKGDYGKTTDWQIWDTNMTKYCIQDVRVCYELYKRMKQNRPLTPQCLELEHQVQTIIAQQIENGFPFDVKGAEKLAGWLASRRAELAARLVPIVEPWYVPDGKVFLPKRSNKRLGYVEGCPVQKLKLVEFNPNSRAHIARVLQVKFGWEPVLFTEKSGEPKIDDEILASLPWREAKMIAAYMMICKRLGQIADGDKAWLKYYNPVTKRIHGYVNSNGAVTGRMTHNSPNVAQTPSVDKAFGKHCRKLYHAIKGYKVVGCDASGLEARCLAHFLFPFDKGEYIDIVLNGKKSEGTDVHGRNMKALGLPKPKAKRWFYAWCYGAGDDLLGVIAGGNADLGAKLKRKFFKAMPAIKQLVDAVQERAQKHKQITGLDGRIVACRSSHSALNTLLQGAGALIMKKALVIADQELQTRDVDYQFVANIHDEFQIMVREDQAELAGQIARQAIIDAGKHFNFRIPLDAEYAIGDNWAETH